MIACLFYRRVIARCIDAGETLPEKAQSHLKNCPGCGQSYELEREVTRRLVAGAAQRNQSPPPFLHTKIMASLRRDGQTAQPAPRFLRSIWAPALVIVALGLFSAALIRDSMEFDQQIGRRVDQTPRTGQFSGPSP